MSAPPSRSERFVTTRDVHAAVKGHETRILDALGVEWGSGRPHIRCPYRDHPDNHPSWRWDAGKMRAVCTCIDGSHDIFQVVMKIEGVSFEAAKVRVAELLRRPDLIREQRRARKSKVRKGGLAKQTNNNSTPAGCPIADYAAAKRLTVEFLLSLGIREISYQGSPTLRIPYFETGGGEPAIRFRIALDGSDRFRWKKGSKPRLYGLQRLAEARKAGSITIVEGESDCHTLWYAGFPAIGLPGAGNWNEDRDAPLLDTIAIIYFMIEPDRGGETALRWLAKSRIRDRVRLVRVDGFKDASALYLDNPQLFAQRWQAALDVAEPRDAIADRKAAAEAQQAKDAARDLIVEPDILRRVAVEIERAGLAGEGRNAKVLYLVLTTRLFDRPVNGVVKGPSSGGKNFIVKKVVRFFPTEAYWSRTGMSDRPLPIATRISDIAISSSTKPAA